MVCKHSHTSLDVGTVRLRFLPRGGLVDGREERLAVLLRQAALRRVQVPARRPVHKVRQQPDEPDLQLATAPFAVRVAREQGVRPSWWSLLQQEEERGV